MGTSPVLLVLLKKLPQIDLFPLHQQSEAAKRMPMALVKILNILRTSQCLIPRKPAPQRDRRTGAEHLLGKQFRILSLTQPACQNVVSRIEYIKAIGKLFFDLLIHPEDGAGRCGCKSHLDSRPEILIPLVLDLKFLVNQEQPADVRIDLFRLSIRAVQQHTDTGRCNLFRRDSFGQKPARYPVGPHRQGICQRDLFHAVPGSKQNRKFPAVRFHVHIGQLQQCPQHQVVLAAIAFCLFGIETDEPFQHAKVPFQRERPVRPKQPRQLRPHGLIASLRVVKQGEHKQRLLRPCIFSGGQFIQPCAALGSVGFQQIERTLQVNICPGSPAKFLNEIIPLIAYKHRVSLTLAGVAQGQCKSAENAYIRAQLFLEPLQYFTRVTQAVSFKIAGNILISLPDLSHFLLAVKDSHLIVLRHLYDQLRKGVIQRKVNDLLVGTVCRYDFLVHNISLLFTAANARR